MKIQLAGPILHDSLVNGEGFRSVIFCSGCTVKCKGCQNEHTHDPNFGKAVDIENILKEIKKGVPLTKGVTFSGGDPMHPRNAKPFAELAKKIKSELGLNIWCYTGQIYEEILKENNPDKIELLKNIDVLVDGPYIEDKNDNPPKYVGSSNQRILKIS